MNAFRPRLTSLVALLTTITKGEGDAAGTDATQVLNEAYTRLGVLLTKAQEAGGALPDGMQAEVATIVGLLSGLAAPAAAPAAAPPADGASKRAPFEVDDTTKRALVERLTKAELDAFTARVVTINAANERWWRMRTHFEQGRDAEGNAELKGIVDMLNNVVQTTAGAVAAPDATSKRDVSFTATQFATYALAQVQKAAVETKEKAVARLQHLAKLNRLAKAFFFESANEGAPFTVTIESAYAPEGDGKSMGLTGEQDQSSTTMPLATATAATEQPSSMFKAETFDKVAAGLTEMLKELGVEDAAGSASAVAKGAPSTDAFAWPTDMAEALRAEDAARAAPVAKREALDFGRDPWHPARAKAR